MYAKVGPISAALEQKHPVRSEESGSLVVSQAHGAYFEAAKRGVVFTAHSQTGCVWTVGLATTYTGVAVSNPLGSGKNLSILAAGFQEVVQPAGIQAAWLAGGYSTTAVTHSVPGVPVNMLLGGAIGVGKFDTDATLPVAPSILIPLTVGKISAVLSTSAGPILTHVKGLVCVPPGGFVIVAAFTVGAAVGQYGCIVWEEVPIV